MSEKGDSEDRQTSGPKADYGVFLLAIPIVSTLLILFWVGNMNLLQSPGDSMALIMIGTVVGTAILAAMEASKLGMVSDRKKGTYSPTAWFFIVSFLWIIGYPAYLFKRRHYGLKNRLGSGIAVAFVFVGTFSAYGAAIESKKAEVLREFGITEKESTEITIPGQAIVQDYTIMSRVSEAAASASVAKIAITEAFLEGRKVGPDGDIPTNPGALGLEPAVHYAGKYVKAVTYNAQGVVTVMLRDTPDLGSASGKSIVFVPVAKGEGLQWQVSDSSSVPKKCFPRR